ncbi:MAG: S-methyl-5-thioribose-1-phosphate isomerase [Candidatus Zixiibacteriota bacterium]
MIDYYSVKWMDDYLSLLDQTLLPSEEKYLKITDYRDVIEAIKSLRVRGAPAIGVAAAYATVLAARNESDPAKLALMFEEIRAARPTAVNLMWAVDRQSETLSSTCVEKSSEVVQMLLQGANQVYDNDLRMCEAIGDHGNDLIRDGSSILTHCNAGALATAGMGTALAPIFIAHQSGKKVTVFTDETRPLLQGARLTMWELMRHGIDATLLCDSAAAYLMSQGRIDMVIVGADRIAKNGDVANKIGTLSVAIAASRYGIPFYVATPSSTFDAGTPDGSGIIIEERDSAEITHIGSYVTSPRGIRVYAPAFDITPAELITGIISEKGVFSPGEHLT